MMQKIKEIIRKLGRIAISFFVAFFFTVTVFIFGRKKGKEECLSEVKKNTKSKDIQKKKEKEIEKTDAHILVADSVGWTNHLRTKEELRKKFGDDADDIAEAFLRG